MTVNYEYLARSMAQLSGIPVRIYRSGEQIAGSFPVPLPRDPLSVCR